MLTVKDKDLNSVDVSECTGCIDVLTYDIKIFSLLRIIILFKV